MEDSTVLLADKNESVRAALAEMLHATGNSHQLEGVQSLRAAAERIEMGPVDMVVLELSSIPMAELESINEYRRRYPSVSWIVVSLFPDLRGVLKGNRHASQAVKGDSVTVARA